LIDISKKLLILNQIIRFIMLKQIKIGFTFMIMISFISPGKNVSAQIVYIPDAFFKESLVNNPAINTNGDEEIQVSEAETYTGNLNIAHINISDLTGIEAFTSLNELDCSWNELTSLDVSNITTLTYLDCGYNHLTSLNVTGNSALTSLYCEMNQLTNIDVSGNEDLIELFCYFNQLSSLNISDNPALELLHCQGNQITNLDVSFNTSLLKLYCHINELTSLNVSSNILLTDLYCFDNQITSLDVSHNTALTQLDFGQNQISSIDVSENIDLIYLNCSMNQISGLDVSGNTMLTNLQCTDNLLLYLNVKNGNNINFNYFYAEDNPNLYCIQVDDSVWSSVNWTNIDPQSYFNEDCSIWIENDYSETEINLYPNPCREYLTITYDEEYTHLEVLDVTGQKVFFTNLSGQSSTCRIEISGFAKGLYFVKLSNFKTTAIKKLEIF
jgi:hypothetical protein